MRSRAYNLSYPFGVEFLLTAACIRMCRQHMYLYHPLHPLDPLQNPVYSLRVNLFINIISLLVLPKSILVVLPRSDHALKVVQDRDHRCVNFMDFLES